MNEILVRQEYGEWPALRERIGVRVANVEFSGEGALVLAQYFSKSSRNFRV